MKKKQQKNSRVIVITGASHGIGLAAARKFITCGDIVYNLSRTPQADADIKHIKTDITNTNEIYDAFKQIQAAEGRIDVLINNAGFGISGSAECTKPEDIARLMNVNFNGLVNCCSAVLPYMRAQKNGFIINISSLAAVFALPFQSFYSASKAAVTSYTDALRIEVKPLKIRVCSVQLGDVSSDFTDARRKNQIDELCYHVRRDRAIKKYEHDERTGTKPEVIAKKLYKLSYKKNPKPVLVFCFKNKLLVFLTRLFPTRFKNWMVEKMY